MRTLSFLILLATAAAPAVARDHDHGGRNHRAELVQQIEENSQRGGDAQQSQSEQRQSRARRSERPNEQGANDTIRARLIQRHAEEANARSGGAEESEGSTSSWRPRERRIRTIPDVQSPGTGQAGSDSSRAFERRHRRDYQDGNYQRWSTSHWRGDRRYDWRRYRDRNRSLFRLGFYYDPFGWNYRPWSVGSYLYPSYYGSRYRLHDPWHYRLPPAYGPYRWVRYWNDALLVNVHTGQVVDVLHNFFW